MQNKHLLYGVFAALLLALAFGASDNLSELALVFLLLAVVGLGWYMYRRTWGKNLSTAPADRLSLPTKTSAVLGIGGILAIGVGVGGLIAPGLEELAPMVLVGLLALIFALVVRIAGNMRAKRVDNATGAFSILAILGLTAAIGLICLTLYLLYLLLLGIGIG